MKKTILTAIVALSGLTGVMHAYDYNPNLDELRRYSEMRRFADMLKEASYVPVVRTFVDCGGFSQKPFSYQDNLNQYRNQWQADLDRLPRTHRIHPDGLGGYSWID